MSNQIAMKKDPSGNIEELFFKATPEGNIIIEHRINGLSDSRNNKVIPLKLILNYDELLLEVFKKYVEKQ